MERWHGRTSRGTPESDLSRSTTERSGTCNSGLSGSTSRTRAVVALQSQSSVEDRHLTTTGSVACLPPPNLSHWNNCQRTAPRRGTHPDYEQKPVERGEHADD